MDKLIKMDGKCIVESLSGFLEKVADVLEPYQREHLKEPDTFFMSVTEVEEAAFHRLKEWYDIGIPKTICNGETLVKIDKGALGQILGFYKGWKGAEEWMRKESMTESRWH